MQLSSGANDKNKPMNDWNLFIETKQKISPQTRYKLAEMCTECKHKHLNGETMLAEQTHTQPTNRVNFHR